MVDGWMAAGWVGGWVVATQKLRAHTGAGRRPLNGTHQMAIASAAGLALVLPRLAAGCDSSYVFPNTTEDGAPLSDAGPLVRIEAGLQWQQYPQNGSVYLAMAFGVGKVEERQGIARRPCSSGYTGGQIHEDGAVKSETLKISMLCAQILLVLL